MSTTVLPALPSRLVEPLEEHAFSETAREVGGVLVGRLTDEGVTISGFIPALKAEGAATHLTFTHEAWADALDVVDRDHPGEQIVGWYHTHPSYGLFLSEYDLFIHRNFFSDPRMPALVIDPVAGELGWFGWRDDEIVEVARARTGRTAVEHAVDAQARASTARTRRSRAVLAAAGAVVVIGAGAFTAGSLSNDQGEQLTVAAERIAELDQQVADQQGQIRALTDALDEQTPPPAPPESAEPEDSPAPDSFVGVRTLVQPGDSWWSLAERFYGDGTRYSELESANTDISVLDPGDTVTVPRPDVVRQTDR